MLSLISAWLFAVGKAMVSASISVEKRIGDAGPCFLCDPSPAMNYSKKNAHGVFPRQSDGLGVKDLPAVTGLLSP